MLKITCLFAVCVGCVFTLDDYLLDDCYHIGCPPVNKPVCGSNGKTYKNKCELARASCKDETIEYGHKGACKQGSLSCVTEIACIARYAPVCGTDGVTYSNGCYLAVARCRDSAISMEHRGRCQKKLPKQLKFH